MIVTLKYSEIISKQATVNIGTVGHVNHGKSTVTWKLTGIRTQRHDKEISTNCTINLGYANAKIFYCPKTGYCCSRPSQTETATHPVTNEPLMLVQHISIVDCPGHSEYMSTMIGGSRIMDMAMIIIAGDAPVPQPQTYEHLLALQQSDVAEYIVLHNKLDLLTREETLAHRKTIDEFLLGSRAQDAPVIPISAQLGENIEYICQYIVNRSPEIKLINSPPRMSIVRSFNVNRSNCSISDLQGGVVGGTILQGVISVGDLIEIRPGILRRCGRSGSKVIIQPLVAQVVSIGSEKYKLEYAVPGGLIALQLSLDAGLTVSNKLVGQLLGEYGTLPAIYTQISISYHLLKKLNAVAALENGERVSVILNAMVATGTVTEITKKGKLRTCNINLVIPLCADIGSKLAILKNMSLVASGQILNGTCQYDIVYPAGVPESVSSVARKIYQIEYDLPTISAKEFNLSYDDLLTKVSLRTRTHKKKFVLPQPEILREIKYTHICNINDIVTALDHTAPATSASTIATVAVTTAATVGLENMLIDFIKTELTPSARLNGDHHLVLDGVFTLAQIQKILANFLNIKFKCPVCKQYRTVLYRENRIIRRRCTECTANTTVTD